MAKIADAVIKYSFYLLFLFVPLVFFAGSSELFEFNKMMLTYGLTIIIVSAWLIKLSSFRFSLSAIRLGPIGIPLLLYLTAHLLSTIFSIDPHISIWGYYSRFHEGLLASISYVLLYFAAINNLHRSHVIRILLLSFISASLVSIYGLFEHFGASPSCLLITGNFNVDCWVQDVKNRVFATLGQPNWMAAYLDIVILTSLGFISEKREEKREKNFSLNALRFALPALLFVGLLFTKSRSGILGLIIGLVIFLAPPFWQWLKTRQVVSAKPLLILLSLLTLLSLLFGLPFSQIEKFSLESLLSSKSSTVTPSSSPLAPSPYIDIGISESGDIRRIVWQGAIKIWQRYPILGSGVETFAYAYYKDRPIEHNMVSEWDFLYNKAHNEFLNILATTGTVGFLSYLGILGVFAWWFIKNLKPETWNLTTALFAAWLSILVTNFFGFSVVIIGLYFFLIPAFCFLLSDKIPANSSIPTNSRFSSSGQLLVALVIIVTVVLEWNLISMWRADKAYAYGKNLDSIQYYVQAYPYLTSAVSKNPGEPTFHDELAVNEAVIASALESQINSSSSSAISSLSAQEKRNIPVPVTTETRLSVQGLIDAAIADSNSAVNTSPNSLPFWKTRTRLFAQLATIDPKYNLEALFAITKAVDLAPTDAKVHYNLGVIQARTGDVPSALKTFEETIAMKPDYRDAYYNAAILLNQTGNKVRAKETMQLILSKIGPDKEAQKWLEENK